MKRHLGLLAAACVLASIPCSRARADERYDGLQAHAQGNWKEAYARLSSVHRTHPDESEVALKVYDSAFNLLRLLRLEKRPAEGLEVARFLESMDKRYLNNDHPGWIALARARVMLDLGRADEAIASYQRARDALPGLAGLAALGELALAHEAKRDWLSVIAVLQQYSSRNGTMTPELLTLRARAEERSGAVHQAATSIQTALSARPDDAGLKVLQTTVGRQWTPAATVKARFDEFFTLEFQNIPEQETYRERILQAVRRARTAVFGSFGFKSSRQIRVVIYPSGESYTNASGAPAWSGAVFDGNLRIPISPGNLADDRALLRVTTHELTHFVIGEITWTTCPAWLNEGLAQLEEGADMKWAGHNRLPLNRRPGSETSRASMPR